MNNTVYNTKKEKLKNQLSNLNQKQFDKAILKSIGNDKLETFTMWQEPTIEEYQKEIARLNKIIDELEKELKSDLDVYICSRQNGKTFRYAEKLVKSMLLDKLQELKEEGKNE